MCLFNQSGGEEEKGPEPEPVREYTPAGRALKIKFAKLRARQKERLAKRGAVNESHPVEGLAGTESLMHSPAIAKGGDLGAGPVHSVQEGTSVNTEDNRYAHLSETQNSNADSLSRIDKLSKHKSNHFDVSVNNPGRSLADLLPPSHHNKGGININSTPTNNFAPVLGLCAPNANQIESSESNISKLNWRQNRHGARQEFPFSLGPCSGTSMDAEVRNKETAANTKLSDTLTENLQQSFKNSIPDNILPFVPFPFSVQGKESDAFDNSGARFSAFQEKMTLPNLPFDERLLARFPHTTKNIPNSHLDLLPNLSLGSRLEALNGSMQDLPTLPALPTFKIPPEDLFRYNQKDRDVPPTLGLGQRPTTFSSFPENHRKVLENIMMRTGSGSSSLLKKKSKSDVWSEDELDSLWIGVRRHGRGNWDGMLRDPKLNFSKYKTSEDLSIRWEEEQVKIFQGPPFPVQRSSSKTSKSTKSANFPISDGMMERALQGSKFLLPPKFHNHMTDIKLGIGDSPSSLPHFRTMDQPSLQNNHFGSFPSWRYDVNRAKFPEDASAQTSERPGTSSNVPTERPFLQNSFGSSSLSAIGLNCSGSIGLQQKEEDPRNKRGKLPVLLDGLPDNMRNNRINVGSGESTSSGLLSNPIKPDFVNSKGEEIAGSSSSSKDKLPHWLREAVSSPPKLPDPELPPTVSAIAQSVRMLYGDDKPAIPPFVVPGPPPSLPKDPRCSIKKKKKRSHKPKQNLPDFAGTSKDFQNSHHVDNGASSSALLPPPFPLLPQTGTPGPQQMESDLNLPPLNLKVPNLSYSSVQSKKSNFGLSPSPEVLQLVASCVAPGPHISSVPSSSNFLEGELPLPRPVGVAKFKDSEGAFRNRKPREISPEVQCSPQEHKVEQDPDSGDSSKTQSDPSRVERPGKGESSSEGTVSDNSARDQET